MAQTQILMMLSEIEFVSRTNIWVLMCTIDVINVQIKI